MAEKLEKAEDGKVLLDNDDMQKLMEAAKEQEERQAAKNQGNHAKAAGAQICKSGNAAYNNKNQMQHKGK